MPHFTMLDAGPAGTSMIGENNIEAAARRCLEKQSCRDARLQRARETCDASEDDVSLDATLLILQNEDAWIPQGID